MIELIGVLYGLKLIVVPYLPPRTTLAVSGSFAMTRSPLSFLGDTLYLLEEDRYNPMVLMMLLMIEKEEINTKEGLVLLRNMTTNYGFVLGDESLASQLEHILQKG